MALSSSDAALEDLEGAGLPKTVEALVLTLADVFLPPPINEDLDNTLPMYLPAGVRLAHKRAESEVEKAELTGKACQ